MPMAGVVLHIDPPALWMFGCAQAPGAQYLSVKVLAPRLRRATGSYEGYRFSPLIQSGPQLPKRKYASKTRKIPHKTIKLLFTCVYDLLTHPMASIIFYNCLQCFCIMIIDNGSTNSTFKNNILYAFCNCEETDRI